LNQLGSFSLATHYRQVRNAKVVRHAQQVVFQMADWKKELQICGAESKSSKGPHWSRARNQMGSPG